MKKELSVFDKHQLAIAYKTMKMSDAGALIMGGMTKAEAKEIIKKFTGKEYKESKDTSLEGVFNMNGAGWAKVDYDPKGIIFTFKIGQREKEKAFIKDLKQDNYSYQYVDDDSILVHYSKHEGRGNGMTKAKQLIQTISETVPEAEEGIKVWAQEGPNGYTILTGNNKPDPGFGKYYSQFLGIVKDKEDFNKKTNNGWDIGRVPLKVLRKRFE